MPKNFKTFFISDLHLSKNTPEVAALFAYFMKNIIQPGDSLFILGDFFEYWLGEDLLDEAQEAALLQLKILHAQGSPLFFMPGNRDFLIRKESLQKFGLQLLADPFVLEAMGGEILLTHGDALCTDDLAYQRYKKRVTRPWVKWLFLHFPRILRASIAEKVHQQNPHRDFIQNPNYKLADATPSAIAKEIDQYQPDLFIYGHVHKMEIDQHGKTKRMVLGDWHNTGNYIELSETEVRAKVFSL